jgi:S1-C subfamily serine protease
VVDGATDLTLLQEGKPVGHAELVVSDSANDVAVLKPQLLGGARVAIPLSAGPAMLGEHVFTLGYPAPDRLGLSLKMTSGEVSALTGSDVASNRISDPRIIQISIPVQSGNSGGPVIDENGRAVAIVIYKLQMASATEIAQNVNFALKIGYVQALLTDLPDAGGYQSTPISQTTSGAVANTRGSVFLIIASHSARH